MRSFTETVDNDLIRKYFFTFGLFSIIALAVFQLPIVNYIAQSGDGLINFLYYRTVKDFGESFWLWKTSDGVSYSLGETWAPLIIGSFFGKNLLQFLSAKYILESILMYLSFRYFVLSISAGKTFIAELIILVFTLVFRACVTYNPFLDVLNIDYYSINLYSSLILFTYTLNHFIFNHTYNIKKLIALISCMVIINSTALLPLISIYLSCGLLLLESGIIAYTFKKADELLFVKKYHISHKGLSLVMASVASLCIYKIFRQYTSSDAGSFKISKIASIFNHFEIAWNMYGMHAMPRVVNILTKFLFIFVNILIALGIIWGIVVRNMNIKSIDNYKRYLPSRMAFMSFIILVLLLSTRDHLPRYFTGVFILSYLSAIAVIINMYTSSQSNNSQKLLKIKQPICLISLAFLTIISFYSTKYSKDFSIENSIYSQAKVCIENNSNRYNLDLGVSGFWFSRPILALQMSDKDFNINQTNMVFQFANENPYFWLNSKKWYNIQGRKFNFVISDGRQSDSFVKESIYHILNAQNIAHSNIKEIICQNNHNISILLMSDEFSKIFTDNAQQILENIIKQQKRF